MLKKIREARVDFRTGILVIVLTLLVWAVVTYVNVRDFVPPELLEPRGPGPTG